MSLDKFFDNANWEISFGVLGFAWIGGVSLWTIAKDMNRSAIIYDCALDLTKDFYKLADDIMSDPATPELVHDMIHDMTSYVTHDDVGKDVYAHIVDALNSSKKSKTGVIHQELMKLAKHRLDLYEKVGNAVSTWLFAMAAAYGHSDIKVTRTMVDATDRSKLFDITEKLLSWFRNDGPDGKNDGGRRLHIGSC